MEISPLDPGDEAAVAGLLDLRRAVHDADTPEHAAPCSVAHVGELRYPRPGSQIERRVVWADGRIVADLNVHMPTLDNRHFAGLGISVHPEFRRRGFGRTLAETGIDIARRAGRGTISGSTSTTWANGPKRSDAGVEFAKAMGFEPVYTEVIRRADIAAMDRDVEQRYYDQARAKSAGYETIAWTGRVPEELLPGVAEINSTFLDEAPLGGLDVEAENIDVDRVRTNDDLSIKRGIFMCGVVARHIESGQIVANTAIGVHTEPGDQAGQWITIVSPRHRGRRLGMLIKIENLRQLRAERPQVRAIWTGNAHNNAHMIAINEDLGFRPVDAHMEFQRKF